MQVSNLISVPVTCKERITMYNHMYIDRVCVCVYIYGYPYIFIGNKQRGHNKTDANG
jgi:hypothetical protein